MKKLFTLFLTALTMLGFAQKPIGTAAKRYQVMPGSAMPHFVHKPNTAGARSTGACDTADVLDYNTYNELNANNLQISYNGSWNSSSPQPYGQEITSSFININSADNNLYSYVLQAFDSLAFADFNGQNQYSKSLRGSTVSLDSLGMFIGITGDTVAADGKMANDSLVFKFYAINNGTIATTPVATQSYVGYNGLAPFIAGTQEGYLRYAQIQVGQTFNQGQGFAVKVDYYNGDTSSHCIMSYGYADSCGQVVYQGQTFASPAYPSPFVGSSKYGTNVGSSYWGGIDSTAPNTAVAHDYSNAYGYFGLGFPTNCSYLYTQNWQLIAYVTVTSTLGISIDQGSQLTLTCPSASHALTVTKTGDLAGATYTWSSNVSGSQTTANTTIYNPGTYDVTVTNLQMCQATAELVAAYAGNTNLTPTFTVPSSNCPQHPTVFTNTTDTTGGFSIASWTFGQGASGSSAFSPSFTYTSAGTYTVTLTMSNASQCSFQASEIVSVTSTCAGIDDPAFESAINMVPNPSNGNVYLTINGAENNVTVTVYDVIGNVVRAYNTTESSSVFNTTLDLNSVANGTYLVKIQSGNKVATKKLVITK